MWNVCIQALLARNYCSLCNVSNLLQIRSEDMLVLAISDIAVPSEYHVPFNPIQVFRVYTSVRS